MEINMVVSIIVPVYNVEQYLEACLESIIKTDISETEIIIIDDGSTDNSNQIIKQYQQKDSRIKLLEKENGGLSSARNAGLRIASGEYILFVDSDDILYPEKLSEVVENAIVNNSDIVVFDYFEFTDLSSIKYRFDRAYLPEGVIGDHELIINKLFYSELNFAVWNKLYRHSFLTANALSFRENIWFEDLDFGYKAFYYAKIVSKENSVIFGYRQRSGSIMKTVSPRILDKKTILYDIKEHLEDHKEMELFKDGYKFLFFKMYISIIYQVLKNKGDNTIKKEILEHLFNDSYFYQKILRNSKVFRQVNLIEKLIFIQIKFRILSVHTLPLYNFLT